MGSCSQPLNFLRQSTIAFLPTGHTVFSSQIDTVDVYACTVIGYLVYTLAQVFLFCFFGNRLIEEVMFCFMRSLKLLGSFLTLHESCIVTNYINKPTTCTFCVYLFHNFCANLHISNGYFFHHQEFMIYCILQLCTNSATCLNCLVLRLFQA